LTRPQGIITTSPDDLISLVGAGKWTEALDAMQKLHPSDAASDLHQLPQRQQRSLFKLLSYPLAASVLPYLPYYDQFVLLHIRRPEEMRQIVEEMAPDDRMRLLDELPENAWEQLTRELSESERDLTSRLSKYPANSAGRYVTPDYLSFPPSMLAKEALEEIRDCGRSKETVNLAFVLDPDGKLIDEVRLGSLVMASPDTRVDAINDSPLIVVRDTDSLEDVLATFEKYDRLALAVVDADNKMLGILTVDDVMDVARASATREMQKLGGMEALDAPYFSVRLRAMLRKRGGWLVVLFLGEMLTATAMTHFQDEIAAAVVLALFVPLIISSGGNSGSQATSLLIRSLALREVSLRDWWRVCGRELFIGVTLGCLLGFVGFVRILGWQWLHLTDYGPHYLLLAATVWLSLIGVVGFGTFAGSMLPFMLRRCGFDPAASSAPLVATVVDVTGLVIYFSVAHMILRGALF
jgi:magnesium transporter